MTLILLRLLRLVLGLSVLLALGVALVAHNPLTTEEAEIVPATRRNVDHADVGLVGANFYLDREVEFWKKELTFKMAQEAGIGWARILFSWEGIEPRRGTFFDDAQQSTWKKFDELVDLAERYEIKIIARLDRTPRWARLEGSTQTSPPTSYRDYWNFVATVAERYKGRIEHIQIWNEPNLATEWGGEPVDSRAYLELLRGAYSAIKGANPDALVLSAPMAQTLDDGGVNRTDLSFVAELYELGWSNSFDILSANAYGFDRPPDDEPSPEVLNFRRLELLRETMVENGDAEKPIWVAEFGWNASPEDFPEAALIWRRVTEREQAEYTERGLRLAAQRPWIGVVNIWYFRQVGDYSALDDSNYYFRLVDVDFTPRLPFFIMAEFAQEVRVAGPGWHEEASRVVSALGGWRSRLAAEASGGAYLTPERPGDRMIVEFEGTNVAVVFFGGSSCGAYFSQIDGAPSQEFAVPGMSLSLSASGGGELREVVVGSGLGPGVHRLEIVNAARPEGVDCGIDALRIEQGRASFQTFELAAVVGLAALALLAITSLVVRRFG